MICYVVTSLENAAREELALCDIEKLQAEGVFNLGEQDEAKACVLVAANAMAAAEELVAKLDPCIPTHIFDARLHLNFAEHVMLALSKRNAVAARMFSKKLSSVLGREAKLLFEKAHANITASSFERIVFLEGNNEYLVHVFSAAGLPVDVMVHDGLPTGELSAIKQAQRLFGFKATQVQGCSIEEAHLSAEARKTLLDNALSATLRSRRAWLDSVGFHFSGSISVKCATNLANLEHLQLETNEGNVLFEFNMAQLQAQIGANTSDNKSSFTIPFIFTLNAEQAENLPLATKLFLRYEVRGLAGCSGIRYCKRDFGKRGTGRVGKVLIDENNEITCFFSQTEANFCQLVSRKAYVSDTPVIQRRIRAAWLLSKFQPFCKKIVLWEKYCLRYEESARRVYERLIDEGDKRARFILDEVVLNREIEAGRIKPAYQSQIVKRCSFEHYHLLFSAKTFIGTEKFSLLAGMHPASRLIRRYMENARFDYVFLQHGVMYMITLGSGKRSLFAPPNSKGKRRVVVSSELEKEHFVQSGGFKPEQLYVCGLPKYDANVWNTDADIIAVMPTWRPWDECAARSSFTKTSYYNFLLGICEAVPPELRSKMRVLVHPRFKEYTQNSDFPLAPYMVVDTPYDEVLQQVKLLITDYSSISYDAFYRGANVLFDWEELDECMQAYGQGVHLMLTRELAFGEVYYGEGGEESCVDEGGFIAKPKLRALIEKAYTSEQDPEHVKRYKQIVSFHDGKNTERLMEMMRKDRII